MKLEQLNTKVFARNLLVFEELPSTNDYLKEQGSKLLDGTLVIAQNQTAGKGRLGRVWEMKPGETLAMSILLKSVQIKDMNFLPILCAVACTRAIEGLANCSVHIKWPNDLVIGDKKIVGILCESRIAHNQVYAVCGIGINVLAGQDYFDACHLPYGGSIFSCTGKKIQNECLAARIMNELEAIYTVYQSNGFRPFLDEYRSKCVNIGKEVRVVFEKQEQQGFAMDIDQEGRMLVNLEGKLVAISSGEASVRGLYGYI